MRLLTAAVIVASTACTGTAWAQDATTQTPNTELNSPGMLAGGVVSTVLGGVSLGTGIWFVRQDGQGVQIVIGVPFIVTGGLGIMAGIPLTIAGAWPVSDDVALSVTPSSASLRARF